MKKEFGNGPIVSVLCLAYNHEKFIRKALDGFVMQETNFEYEVLIHDDASTDGTADIVREYAVKYPDIIKPVFQKENQFKAGVFILADILLPMARGKYVALCEGDDYWIDKNKLQLQFEYMEEHPECAMCVHNTKIHYLDNCKADEFFNSWEETHIMSAENVFFGWNVHTSSYFCYKECVERPDFSRFWAGDYAMLTLAYDKGEIVALPYVMSVYNANNPQGATYLNNNSGVEICIEKQKCRANYLIHYDEYTKGRHSQIVAERIAEINFECQRTIVENKIRNCSDYEELKEAVKKLYKDAYYRKYYMNCSIKEKIKARIMYNGCVLGRLWFLGVLIYQKR